MDNRSFLRGMTIFHIDFRLLFKGLKTTVKRFDIEPARKINEEKSSDRINSDLVVDSVRINDR